MALSAVAQRSSIARPAACSRRSAVVVKASAAESRRAVLTGFLAGAAALSVSESAFAAASSIDIFDDRKVKATGYDAIYEARDGDLTENQRQGRTQARTNVAAVKARAKESESRIDVALEPFVKKNYWTKAREELRLQVGNLRFDLQTLAEAKPKEEKKKALALAKDFTSKVEALDLALRKKDEAKALASLSATKTALDTVLASVI